jgi:nicotinate phosphoribosyltransferase
MQGGRRLPGLETLVQARERCRTELSRLPAALRELEPAPAYPVTVSDALRELAERVDHEQTADSAG